MKNFLKIIYSFNILTKLKEVNKQKINLFKKENLKQLNINNEKAYNETLNDIIKPIDELYDYEIVFEKDIFYIRLTINFIKIKQIILEGKIIPHRSKLFDVIFSYQKNLDNKFYSNINNLVINDEKEILKIFCNLNKKVEDNILNKNTFEFNDIIFNLNNKSISFKKDYLQINKDITNGGVIIDENEYGKYLNTTELPLNKILMENEKPNMNKFFYIKNFVNSKNGNKINNLIIVSNTRLNYWKTFLKDKKTLVIGNANTYKKLCYMNILNYDYIILTLNFLNSNHYKCKFDEYNITKNESFENLREDLTRNGQILWEKEPLFHLFWWNNIVIDFNYDDLKKSMTDQLLINLSSFKRWVIYNNFKEKKSYAQNIFSLFSNKLDCKNLKNFVINNKIFEPKLDVKMEKIYLEFNPDENKGYNDYVESLKNIYIKNEMKFEEDEYLQKYCSYPQRQIKINKILKNLNDTNKFLKMNKNYQNLVQDKINQANNEKITCKICLDEIDTNNMGITECGHLFCYSCIYKNIKYSNKCPTCRDKISLDKIFFLTDKNKEIVLNINILDELGTKNSKLLMLLNNFNKVMILSNFDECLDKLKDLFDELNIKNVKTKEKNESCSNKMVYLSNYNEDFYNYKSNFDIEQIICLEPYYSNKKKIKFHDIIKSTNTNKFKFLLIKNTIEDTKIF
jgi:hypothetical protein